jgi:hypothetical protein
LFLLWGKYSDFHSIGEVLTMILISKKKSYQGIWCVCIAYRLGAIYRRRGKVTYLNILVRIISSTRVVLISLLYTIIKVC